MKVNPVCFGCKHFHPNLTCEAYPEGIRADILAGLQEHAESLGDDNGIVFEAKEE